MTTIHGVISNVYVQAAKSELSADVPSLIGVLPVVDAYPFEPTGGNLSLNGTVYAYTSVDLEANTITLSGLLLATAFQDDEVAVYPAGSTKFAMLETNDGDEGVRAIVPFGLKDRLDDGIRDLADQESAAASDDTGRWQLESLDDEIVVITGTLIRTAAEGSRIEIVADDQGGIINFYLSPEWQNQFPLPGIINPRLSFGGAPVNIPLIEIEPPGGSTVIGGVTYDMFGIPNFQLRAGGATGGIAGPDPEFRFSGPGGAGSPWGPIMRIDGPIYNEHGYKDTTGAAANAFFASDWHLARSTSLRRAKLDIKPFTREEIESVLKIEGVSFFDKGEVERNGGSTEGLRRIPSAVAEQVEEVAPLFATYDDDGLNGISHERVAYALIPIVREQREEIAALKERIDRLEKIIAELT